MESLTLLWLDGDADYRSFVAQRFEAVSDVDVVVDDGSTVFTFRDLAKPA